MKFILAFFLLFSCAHHIHAPKKEGDSFDIRWSKNLAPYYRSGNSAYNRKSPLIAQGLVLAGEGLNYFSAYDLETGVVKWRVKEQHQIVAGVAASDEAVVYGTEFAELVSRDLKNGKLNYRVKLSASPNARPIIVADKVVISLQDHSLVALSHKNGELIWNYQRPLAQEATLERGSHPLVYGDQLITGFDDGYIVSLGLETGVVKWERRLEKRSRFLDLDLKPLYAHRRLYVGGGSSGTYIIDPSSGLIGKRLEDNLSADPLASGKAVVLGTRDGYVKKVSPTGEFLRRVKIANNGISVLRKWGDDIIAITYDSDVFLLDSQTLEPVQKMSLGHPDSTVAHDIAVLGDYASIYTTRYRMYTLKRK